MRSRPFEESDREKACHYSWRDRLRRGANAAFAVLVRTISHRFARSNLRADQTPLENFPALAEGVNCAVLHDGKLVRYAQDPNPVGDDDDSGIGRLHPFNGVEKHALAVRVEAGVRLVEDHEVRVAEERPCKAE